MKNNLNVMKWKKLVALFVLFLICISNISPVLAAVQGTGSWKGYHYRN